MPLSILPAEVGMVPAGVDGADTGVRVDAKISMHTDPNSAPE